MRSWRCFWRRSVSGEGVGADTGAACGGRADDLVRRRPGSKCQSQVSVARSPRLSRTTACSSSLLSSLLSFLSSLSLRYHLLPLLAVGALGRVGGSWASLHVCSSAQWHACTEIRVLCVVCVYVRSCNRISFCFSFAHSTRSRGRRRRPSGKDLTKSSV